MAGGFPEMRVLPARPRRARLRDYVNTIVDRDVADLLKVRRTDASRRLIDRLAIRTASILIVSDLAGLIGVQRVTLDQYLDVLTRLAMVVRVGSWTSGEVRREAGVMLGNAQITLDDPRVLSALQRGPSSDARECPAARPLGVDPVSPSTRPEQ